MNRDVLFIGYFERQSEKNIHQEIISLLNRLGENFLLQEISVPPERDCIWCYYDENILSQDSPQNSEPKEMYIE